MNWLKELLEHLTKTFRFWVIINPWEQGIRIRLGKNKTALESGVHLRIPFADSVFVQAVRLRVVSLPLQTISTKDEKTLSVACTCGYSISNLDILYSTLHHPESTIVNIIQGAIAEYVARHDLNECSPDLLQQSANTTTLDHFGVKFEYVKIVGYAVVKTYRLIQDSHWSYDDTRLTMEEH